VARTNVEVSRSGGGNEHVLEDISLKNSGDQAQDEVAPLEDTVTRSEPSHANDSHPSGIVLTGKHTMDDAQEGGDFDSSLLWPYGSAELDTTNEALVNNLE